MAFCPVGDVCNRMFWIAPRHNVDQALMTKVERLIISINKKIVAPMISDFQRIAKAGAVIAVAGGASKAMALWGVLTSRIRFDASSDVDSPIVSHLVVDDQTASILFTIDEYMNSTPTSQAPSKVGGFDESELEAASNNLPVDSSKVDDDKIISLNQAKKGHFKKTHRNSLPKSKKTSTTHKNFSHEENKWESAKESKSKIEPRAVTVFVARSTRSK